MCRNYPGVLELSPKEKTVLRSFGEPTFSRCAILRNSLKMRDRALGSISNPVVIEDHRLQRKIMVLTMEMTCEVAVHVVDGDEILSDDKSCGFMIGGEIGKF